jgi:hypothetical protein
MLVVDELHAHDFVDRSVTEEERRFIRLNAPMSISGHGEPLRLLQALCADREGVK